VNAFYATFCSVLFGGLAWSVIGLVLNIAIPLAALVVCCEHLPGIYYLIAYWLPLVAGAIVAALTFIAARKAFDLAA